MKGKTVLWLSVAVMLVLIGCVIFVGVMTVLKWDFTKLSTSKFETNLHEITDEFHDISVLTDTAGVVFAPAAGEAVTVECYEQKNITHTVSVKDGVLTVEVEDTRKWYEHIGINFGSPKVTVRIPAGEYGALSVRSTTGDTKLPADFCFESVDISATTGDVECSASVSGSLNIKLTTGDIDLSNVSAHSLDLSVTTGEIEASYVTCIGDVTVNVSTGDVELMAVTCGTFSSRGSTGDLSLKNLIADEIVIKRSTGDVGFELMNSRDISITTDTGDVEGTLLTGKTFDAQSDTGRVRVPDSDPTTGERCKVRCSTGSIKITVASF
ncbi:MAG: DUF4097 family beta strand repeat protein [Clostridia bacterium]|nr:DUF4097 family beta strand repeat protein [Clostridia bacterium]